MTNKIERESITGQGATVTAILATAWEAFKRERQLREIADLRAQKRDADPEDGEPFKWWTAKTQNLLPGQHEFQSYSAVRDAWQRIISDRHGYSTGMDEWQAAFKKVTDVLRRLLKTRAMSAQEIKGKSEFFRVVTLEGYRGDADFEQLAQVLASPFFAGIAADLDNLSVRKGRK